MSSVQQTLKKAVTWNDDFGVDQEMGDRYRNLWHPSTSRLARSYHLIALKSPLACSTHIGHPSPHHLVIIDQKQRLHGPPHIGNGKWLPDPPAATVATNSPGQAEHLVDHSPGLLAVAMTRRRCGRSHARLLTRPWPPQQDE